ncbi:hypothetical protein [Variovorax sp. UC74_104]|uniref:hypothetical protein n=1 Tax=Variovorax sp. UC74_104 TaxID=3374555 RepID=UPI0037577F93
MLDEAIPWPFLASVMPIERITLMTGKYCTHYYLWSMRSLPRPSGEQAFPWPFRASSGG